MSPQIPTKSDVPTEDIVKPLSNGGIEITTTRTADHQLRMEWVLDTTVFPDDALVIGVDTRVCGHGSGDMYELYGPIAADPVEYELKPPGADGCWHFIGDESDYTVTIYAWDNSTFTIDLIEFAVTFDR
jgi:hypothetical protein